MSDERVVLEEAVEGSRHQWSVYHRPTHFEAEKVAWTTPTVSKRSALMLAVAPCPTCYPDSHS